MVLLRSILLMGVPVSGKNMFPSNIAGLPTWYTIRASKQHYIARKKEVDFLVAMNAGNGQGRRPDARARRRRRLRRAAEAQRAAQRPGVLSGAVRHAGQAGLPGREAAPPRQEHDLSRHPREAARDRSGPDGEGARQAARQEGQGGRPERRRAEGRLGLRRGDVHQAGPVRHRADERNGRQDPHRRQRRRRHRLHDGRRHRRRLVSDYAVLVAVRVAHRLHEEVPRRQGNREGDVRDRAGRRRDRLARHGDRRELGGRAVDDRDGRSRHLADGRVRRPGVLRGDAGRDLRRPARRAVDRPADPHGAGRPGAGGVPVARRHQAPDADPVLGGRVLHDGDGGVRPRRTVPDAGLRDDGPRPRHEQLDVGRVHLSDRRRSTAARC